MKPPLYRSTSATLADRLKDVMDYAEIKRLADNLMILQRQKKFRSLAILSFFPEEGKTIFAAMLALAYTDACASRVLVVDTTTSQNPQSLVLKQCLPAGHPQIDFISLEEYRRGSNGNGNGFPSKENRADTPTLEADVVSNGSVTLWVQKKSDQFLIRKMAEERAGQYGLVLMDTAPLTIRNKNNVDPVLVARIAEASVLVASPRLLNTPNLEPRLKALKDPTMHLIGLVSNEGFFQ
jgi:Mrp family chromosome partitioning ATPase